MVKANELVHGIVGTLRRYAEAPDKDWKGYQKYCRAYPRTWNKIIKECNDAEYKRIEKEQKLGQVSH